MTLCTEKWVYVARMPHAQLYSGVTMRTNYYVVLVGSSCVVYYCF